MILFKLDMIKWLYIQTLCNGVEMAKLRWVQGSKMKLKISFDVFCDAAEDQIWLQSYISQSFTHSFDSYNHTLSSVVEDCGGEQVLKKEGTG